jgi:hypothetical protein
MPGRRAPTALPATSARWTGGARGPVVSERARRIRAIAVPVATPAGRASPANRGFAPLQTARWLSTERSVRFPVATGVVAAPVRASGTGEAFPKATVASAGRTVLTEVPASKVLARSDRASRHNAIPVALRPASFAVHCGRTFSAGNMAATPPGKGPPALCPRILSIWGSAAPAHVSRTALTARTVGVAAFLVGQGGPASTVFASSRRPVLR